MYCGGPTKDHILESACGGVALFDYDGDGLLDIYLVTAAELTPTRERVPHRNALYRNLGGWKFEDVSRQAGVDLAAWGSGACAGDFDGDGRLDLYVTNWGPNALFRNRGDGTFENVAAAPASPPAAGARAARSSMPTPTAISTSTSRATSRRRGIPSCGAQRTLVWRSGPHIMVGPAGLPGESDLFFENVGNGRFVEADRRARPLRSHRGPTASASWRPITTTTGSSTCSSPTTRTRISCITTSATAASKASD